MSTINDLKDVLFVDVIQLPEQRDAGICLVRNPIT